VSWPCCWQVCLDFFEMSFRSLLPLPASKFWAWRKNTSAIAKCSCLWSFCSFQPLPSSRGQYEVLIENSVSLWYCIPQCKNQTNKKRCIHW
jgi:hypothetical protein